VLFALQLFTHADYRKHLNWSGAVITLTTGEKGHSQVETPDCKKLVRKDENYLFCTISRKGLQRKAHSGAA
jgi:hypothetical protein